MQPRLVTGLALALLLAPLISNGARADGNTETGENDNRWALCRIPAAAPIRDPGLPPDTPVAFTADEAAMERLGTSVLSGDVHVERGPQKLDADEVRYNKREGRIIAEGDVRFSDRGLIVEGPLAELQIDTDEAELTDARYRFAPLHARGRSQRMRRESSGLVTLREASYTTCDPSSNFWLLSAGRVRLDRDTGVGQARDVVLRLSDAPIFYTPYISFPLDDRRKSGFLAPSVGSSSGSGADISIPYYWNIAPDRDATLTPRLLAQRGVQLQSEFRYLNPGNAGQLDLEYLDDGKFGDDRYLIGFDHGHRLLRGLTADLQYNRVSDDDYFDDLGSSLSISSITHLERHGALRYGFGPLRSFIRVQDYQTIDETIPEVNEPYERLPQIVLEGELFNRPLGFDYDLHNEWVRFEHDERVNAERLNLELAVARPFIAPGWFVTPAAEFQYTAYSLSNLSMSGTPDTDSGLDRSLPTFSLDSGLIFEREAFGGGMLQTLEPRLFYLYTPFRSQDEIPLFDTNLLDFTFSQLFRTDRFSGPDRVSDANQLTAALTTRFLNPETGRETFSASIGQIRYFEDREVTLPGREIEEDNDSALAGELILRLGESWWARWSVLWDPEESQTQRSGARLSYQGQNNRILSLSYSQRLDPRGLRQETLEQADVAFAWPLTPRWRILGRWNYDLENERELEILAGLEYESCCWALRLVGRRYLNNFDEFGLLADPSAGDAEYKESIELQLVLKGLTSLGSSLGDLLESGILGYEDEY